MDHRSPASATTSTPEILRAAQQNRVMRNTYLLLAISLLPMIVGAVVGMTSGFVTLYIQAYMKAPILTPLAMLGVIMGSFFIVTLLRNSAWGIAALFGFTFMAGLLTAPILTYAAGLSNGWQLVALAAGMTATIFFVLASIASVSTRDFSFLGKFLFTGVILLLIAIVANIFFKIPALSLAISCVAVLIFSAYILYDVNRIVRGGETNYIMATLSLFVDIWLLFIHLLNILLTLAGQRE